MSMGPNKKDDGGIHVVGQIRHAILNTTKTYFSDPLYYLFYIALSATILALFMGWSFSWPYYSILSILGSVQVWKFYVTLNNKEHGGKK